MRKGKYLVNAKTHNQKTIVIVLALVALLVASVGGTIAFLTDDSDPVVNTFTPQLASIEVNESFDNTAKSNVYISNTCDIPVYVRVALIPTWEDDNGNPVGVTASLSDLTFTGFPGTGWVKGSDGYYYYTSPVAADGKTEVLIGTATVATENGYHMNLQVLAQCIQADGVAPDGTTKPVVDAWGAAEGGSVTGVNGTTLQIA